MTKIARLSVDVENPQELPVELSTPFETSLLGFRGHRNSVNLNYTHVAKGEPS